MSLLADTATTHDDVTGRGVGTIPDSSRGERPTSWVPADFPVPHGREEEWRFSPVDRLGRLLRDEPTPARLDRVADLPEGVTLTDVTPAQAREREVMVPGDRPAALAAAHADSVMHLDVPADTDVQRPVRVRLTGADHEVVHAHVLVTAGRHSRATVILEHAGSAELAELVSVVADDGADLTLVSLQEWDDDAVHLTEQDVVVGRDARVRHIAVTLGGRIVRVSTNTSYTGPGGSFEGLGVYFADSGQHQEHRLFVDHAAPHCTSNVEYKGALQGETARTVWIGDVLIRAEAEGTDTYELNRNLVLSDGARADSVPNLEIETGEIVGAGHASATGRFDDEQLFYLRSRGVPEDTARRLVVRGFFASIIGRIGVPEVVDHLMQAVDAELAGAPLEHLLPRTGEGAA